MHTPIASIKFWINAFIPLHVPGYTRAVPAGLHKGKTMIPGPTPVSDCYLTDQRNFDANISAKSRMHSEFKVDFTGSVPTMTQWHNCDQTTELDCADGDVESSAKGNTSRMTFEQVTMTTTRVVIDMVCASSNPCAPSSRIGGDIDYHGRITFDAAKRVLEVDGMIDAFPAFEAYATINDGAGYAIFQMAPPTGNTVMNLPKVANRPVRFRIQDCDGNGVFDSRTAL